MRTSVMVSRAAANTFSEMLTLTGDSFVAVADFSVVSPTEVTDSRLDSGDTPDCSGTSLDGVSSSLVLNSVVASTAVSVGLSAASSTADVLACTSTTVHSPLLLITLLPLPTALESQKLLDSRLVQNLRKA